MFPTKESVLFNARKALSFIKKYRSKRKDYRDATKGDTTGEQLFIEFEKALNSIWESAKKLKREEDTIDVTDDYAAIKKCRQFIEEEEQEVITRDKCIDCDEVKEIVQEGVCFDCAAQTQADSLYDNFAVRMNRMDEDDQDEYLDLYNAFVTSVEVIRENCTEENYNKMADLAEQLNQQLPQLEEEMDEEDVEDEDIEEEEEEEEEEESSYTKKRKRITIYQLKRVFKDYPDQEQILPGLYTDMKKAKKVQENDDFKDGETVITTINL